MAAPVDDLPGAGRSESVADSGVLSHRNRRLGASRHHPKADPAGQPLTLRDADRAMAKLGGFLGRKSDGEPGVKTLWRGYRPLQWLCGWDRVRQNPS